MGSPNEIYFKVLRNDIDFNARQFLVSLKPTYSMHHVPEQTQPGFKSTHQIQIEWAATFLELDQVPFAEFKANMICVLLYRHSDEVEEKFKNMLVISYQWCKLEYESVRKNSILELMDFPEFVIDEEKMKEVTDLLLASDKQ